MKSSKSKTPNKGSGKSSKTKKVKTFIEDEYADDNNLDDLSISAHDEDDNG